MATARRSSSVRRPTSGRWRSCAALAVGVALLAPATSASAQSWTQNFPTGGPPQARNLAGVAYDSADDVFALFSGGTALGYATDTWTLQNATGIGGSPQWVQLFPTGGPPTPRGLHSGVYAAAGNRLIVYGGCLSNCGLAAADTWVLTNADGTGGTPAWSLLPAIGADNREAHVAVYDDATNRMIVVGGQNGFNTYAGNPIVRVLTNADGTGAGTPTWLTPATTGGPPGDREGAGVAYDAANNRLIVMGGVRLVCCAAVAQMYNDVWVLTNANGLGGTPTWTQLAPTGTPPPQQYWHTAVYDAGTNELIVFGGTQNGGTLGDPSFNDVWVLSNANGVGGTPAWTQAAPSGTPPATRWGHAAGYNPAYDAMPIAFGRSDSPFTMYNDSWVLNDANGVRYDFTGFFSPVNNQPMVNAMKAGRGVPVKFSLGGDQGLDIFVDGYPRSRAIDCDSGDPVDGVEETVTAGGSELSYNATTDQYTYVWKTNRSWAGSCRRLELRLDDGTVHLADFEFKS